MRRHVILLRETKRVHDNTGCADAPVRDERRAELQEQIDGQVGEGGAGKHGTECHVAVTVLAPLPRAAVRAVRQVESRHARAQVPGDAKVGRVVNELRRKDGG